MESEFNELAFNNTNETFNNNPDNLALSDELAASALYQDSLGTNYSRKKRLTKLASATGLAILVTAASINSRSMISNSFILNPPTAKMTVCEVVDGVFNYEFTIKNTAKYQVVYYIDVDGVQKKSEDCSASDTYKGSFSEINDGEKGVFYINFTNKVDYIKTIKRVTFNKGGIINDGN